ncbi:MAG: phosphoribosylanthranilate isomerase [Coriobacteriales bacterium]|jgi:phosphoribosylanthranilate isomerase
MKSTATARQRLAREFLLDASYRTRVKFCGLKTQGDVAAANHVKPDLCGFITDYPASRRSLSCSEVRTLAARVDAGIFTVSVTVNAPVADVGAAAEDGMVDLIQLHGDEGNDYIDGLRALTKAGIIQAFRIDSPADVDRARASAADMVLLDAGRGEGRTFNWNLISGFDRPFILAGGLSPENVGVAIEELHPWGIDVSTGIETDGSKDEAKMAAIMSAVRGARSK